MNDYVKRTEQFLGVREDKSEEETAHQTRFSSRHDPNAPKATYHIYTLSDPTVPNRIFYVGMTINPRERFLAHCNPKKGFREEKRLWLNTILAFGRRPTMNILMTFEATRWKARQIEWQFITKFAKQGHPLANNMQHPAKKGFQFAIWDNRAWRTLYSEQ